MYSSGPCSKTAGEEPVLSVTFTPDDTANYNSVTSTTTINVFKATPAVSWANPADITYGTVLGVTQLNATATVPGSFVYSVAPGTCSTPVRARPSP